MTHNNISDTHYTQIIPCVKVQKEQYDQAKQLYNYGLIDKSIYKGIQTDY